MASNSPRGEAFNTTATQSPTTPSSRAVPQYPPHSRRSIPMDESLERTTSRRRKGSGQDQYAPYDQPELLPVAPEAPRSARGPPSLSYRDPYMNTGMYTEQGPSSMSFAARAGIVPDKLDIQQPEVAAANRSPQSERRGSRRGSIKQAPEVVYSHGSAPRETRYYAPGPINEPTLVERNNSSAKRQQRPLHLDTTQHSPRNSGPISASNSSPPVRSASYKPTPSQPREWAADRSPLQKLEVKLNDISKEEKRARVELAEQKLRESQGVSGSRRASQSSGAPIRQVSTAKRAVSGPTVDRRSASGVTSEAARSSTGSGVSDRRNSKEQQVATSSAPRHPSTASAIPTRSSSQRYSTQSRDPKDSSRRRSSVDNGRSTDRGVRFHHEVDDIGSGESPKQETQSTPTNAMSGLASLPKSTRQQVLSGKEGSPDYDQNTKERDIGGEDPVPGHAVRSSQHGLKYEIPPQTAAGIETRKQVGFGSRLDEKTDIPTHHRPHLSAILHHGRHDRATPGALKPAAARHLDEWRRGGVAHLSLLDLEHNIDKSQIDKNKAWWEKNNSSRRRSKAEDAQEADQYDGYLDEQSVAPSAFNPPLLLKCGPMIRYTGMKRQKPEQSNKHDLETWRGSVMIVTEDDMSSYDPPPSLRLFHQPMQLLPPPPPHFDGEEGEGLDAEYVDPIGGLPKISRSGGTVYVKPVEDLEEGKDISRIEDDDGLYEAFRTANVPTSYGKANELLGLSPHSPHPRNQAAKKEGRQVGQYREVKGVRLHAERGVTFWRFNLEIELDDKQQRIAYRINRGASVGFWVPARGQTMNVMFHSCNGFSLSVDSNTFSGPDPLWRDVMNAHQIKPFHVMIGGGDQIYNDAVMKQTRLFQDWTEIKNPKHKHEAPFSPEMRDELESFYLERYSMWFSQGLFGMANSQIPMINMWDDHDIIDGYGSYPHHFMGAPVFCGLGNIAFKYYMLFQHQSVVDETSSDEPSWLLGASPGPYINELSRSVFVHLGKKVVFLGLDCRTERMRDEILSEASYDLIFERLHREIVKGETKHLIVLLGVPIAYPRLVWLENVLTSRALDPLKALGRMGLLGNVMNKFDGGVEILDDLDDHWTAKNHKEERNWFIEELQELAAEKSVRVTILGGDVHLAAVGQFYSHKRLMIPKDRDFRYMPNIVSSAIVNTPPPDMMADILNRRNKIHHLNAETDEDMIPMFTHDVDGKSRNNKRLLPKRNWCSITEYNPGSTPPPTPPSTSPTASDESLPQQPGLVQRTLSLGRGTSKPAKLIRRLSLGGKEPDSPQDSTSFNRPPADDSPLSSPNVYNRAHPSSTAPEPTHYDSAPIPTRPINTFHRRPTNLSEKAAAKGGAIGEHVNLELGLDISLNCEIKQGDPSGSTEQYRLLIPALFYDGPLPEHKKMKVGIMKRLSSIRRNRPVGKQKEDWSDSGSEDHSDAETGSDISDEPKKGGTLRRLSGVFSRPTNLLQKQQPAPSAPSAPQPFRSRPQAEQNAHPSAPLSISAPRPLASNQPQRSSPITAYHPQAQFSQPASPSQPSPRGAVSSNTNVPSPLKHTHQAATAPPAAAKVSHNQTAPLDYDSDELSEEEELEIAKRSNSRHNRSGASKFFGEDLPPNGAPLNGGATKGAGVMGRQNRNSVGYSGIEAFQDEKKGWRKFF